MKLYMIILPITIFLNVQFMNDVRAASESSGSIAFTLVLSFPHNLPCTVQVFTEETVPVSAEGMR